MTVTVQCPQLPQRQDSMIDQLRDLIAHANRLGMYDAADYLAEVVQRADERINRVRP